MAMIYIKAKEGRRLYFEGRIIPNDKFVPVTDDRYIRRLVDRWGDAEVQGDEGKTATLTKPRIIEKGPTPAVPGGGREKLQPTGEQAPGTGAPKPV